MGIIHVLNEEGDIVVHWDPDDEDSTAKARQEWDELKSNGYEFYAVQETKGRRLSRWDSKAGRIIAAPGAAKPKEKRTTDRPKAMRGGPSETWA